jgi:hypothetical protein
LQLREREPFWFIFGFRVFLELCRLSLKQGPADPNTAEAAARRKLGVGRSIALQSVNCDIRVLYNHKVDKKNSTAKTGQRKRRQLWRSKGHYAIGRLGVGVQGFRAGGH